MEKEKDFFAILLRLVINYFLNKMNPIIKVIGAGGSGSNTVSRMAKFEILGVELISLNTDAQALHFSKTNKKILIGKNVTKRLLGE